MPKFIIIILALLFLYGCKPNQNDQENWETYGGTKKMMRYSTLQSIDTSNVGKLTVAWTYHTRDADTAAHSQDTMQSCHHKRNFVCYYSYPSCHCLRCGYRKRKMGFRSPTKYTSCQGKILFTEQ